MEKRHNVQRQWEWEEEREIACCWMQKSPDKYENPKSGGRKKEPKQGSKRRRKKHALYKHLWRNKSSVFLPRRLNRSWLERGLVAWTTPKSRVSRDKLQPFFTTFSLIRSGLFVSSSKKNFVLFLEVSFSRSICLYLNHALASALFLSGWLDYWNEAGAAGRSFVSSYTRQNLCCVCVFFWRGREYVYLEEEEERKVKVKREKRTHFSVASKKSFPHSQKEYNASWAHKTRTNKERDERRRMAPRRGESSHDGKIFFVSLPLSLSRARTPFRLGVLKNELWLCDSQIKCDIYIHLPSLLYVQAAAATTTTTTKLSSLSTTTTTWTNESG